MERLETAPFRVSRLSLAHLAVALYVRTYWWFAAIVPGFGLAWLLLMPSNLKAIGLMAVLWPLSLPARAILATSKTGKLLEKGTRASLAGETLYLHGEDGGGFRLDLTAVRRTVRTRGFLVLVLSRGDFVAIPLRENEAFATAIIERTVRSPLSDEKP